MAQKAGGQGAMAVMEGIAAVQRRLVNPAAVVQPLTGILLIFESGRNVNFFSYEWLWISMLLYVGVMVLVYLVSNPAFYKMMDLAKEQKAQTLEFQAVAKRVSLSGRVLTAGMVAIIFLMVWKP